MVGVVLALCKAVARLERAVKVLERKELGITIDRDAPEEDDTANLIKE